MPNDTNFSNATANPSFSLGLAPTCLGIISLSSGTGDTARRWRLHQSKCTIGSDRQATIWIDDSKVAAIHALIVFGPHQTIIKTFGPGLKINGQAAQESLLQVGDRIEIVGYSFLVESLQSGTAASKSPSANPNEASGTGQGDQDELTSVALETNLQFAHLEKRVDELLEGLRSIDSKITRSSTEQKEDFVRQCDSLRNETDLLRRAIIEDFSSQLRSLTEDLQRQSDQRESRFETKVQDLYGSFDELRLSLTSKLEEMQRRSDKRLEQLEQEATQLASQNSLSASSADFSELQNRINHHLETINHNFRELRSNFESQLAQLYNRTEEKIVRLEEQAIRVATESAKASTIAKQADDDTQTEIEALQARLSQLESVLADIASSATNQSEKVASSRPEQLQRYPLDAELKTAPNQPLTESFRTDTTTPYLTVNTKREETSDPSLRGEASRTDAATSAENFPENIVANTFETASPLPVWPPVDYRDSADEDSIVGDLPTALNGSWPHQNLDTYKQEDEELAAFDSYSYNEFPAALQIETKSESYDFEPINSDDARQLNSPQTPDSATPVKTSPTAQPMFNQSDWEESDTYLKAERASTVTALDILRASYSSDSRDSSADDAEDNWVDNSSIDKATSGSPSYLERSYATKETTGESSQESRTEDDLQGDDLGDEVETIVETASPYGSSRLGGSGPSRNHSATPSASAYSEDESVEAYMQKLLARMRGEEPSNEPSGSTSSSQSKTVVNKSANSKAVRNTYSPLRKTRQDPAAALIASRPKVDSESGADDSLDGTESIDSYADLGSGDSTLPRSAPEKVANLAALRELANDSARTAISSSDKKPKPLSYTIKLAVSILSGCVGGVLMYNNGMQVNMTLIAATAAFMLSAIWGLDVIQMGAATPKPDKPANGNKQVQMKISGRK